MEGDPPGRMEVEGDAFMAVETDLFFNANDSNKCQCPSPIVESTTAVDDGGFCRRCLSSELRKGVTAINEIKN